MQLIWLSCFHKKSMITIMVVPNWFPFIVIQNYLLDNIVVTFACNQTIENITNSKLKLTFDKLQKKYTLLLQESLLKNLLRCNIRDTTVKNILFSNKRSSFVFRKPSLTDIKRFSLLSRNFWSFKHIIF